MNDKKLIINADDFGIHPHVNEAIGRGYREGLISSASLMVNGDAFDHAVQILREHPGIDAGIHLNVTQGRPVSSPKQVPSLLGLMGCFYNRWPVFVKAFLKAKIRLGEVAQEWRSQIEKLRSLGIVITHLDSHQHVHWFPPLFPYALGLAREFQIPFVRLPRFRGVQKGQSLKRRGIFAALKLLEPFYTAAARRSKRRFVDGLAGEQGYGSLNEALSHASQGLHELEVHVGTDFSEKGDYYRPGFGDRNELAILKEELTPAFLQKNGWKLSSFHQEASRG